MITKSILKGFLVFALNDRWELIDQSLTFLIVLVHWFDSCHYRLSPQKFTFQHAM